MYRWNHNHSDQLRTTERMEFDTKLLEPRAEPSNLVLPRLPSSCWHQLLPYDSSLIFRRCRCPLAIGLITVGNLILKTAKLIEHRLWWRFQEYPRTRHLKRSQPLINVPQIASPPWESPVFLPARLFSFHSKLLVMALGTNEFSMCKDYWRLYFRLRCRWKSWL